jgi:predicted PilT family ATPase
MESTETTNVTTDSNGIETVTTTVEQLIADKAKLEALLAHKTEAYQNAMDKYWKANAANNELRNKVRDYFKAELGGDKDATVELDLDDINDLLDKIGANNIKFTYSAKVTISFMIDGVEADDEEDAESKISEAVSWQIRELEHDSTYDEEIEVTDVEAE